MKLLIHYKITIYRLLISLIRIDNDSKTKIFKNILDKLKKTYYICLHYCIKYLKGIFLGSRIAEINNFLQEQLKKYNLDSIAAVEAARWLDNAGILKDSDLRPGLPLRRYLRANKIIGGEQENSRWRIYLVLDYDKIYSVEDLAQKANISKELVYKLIEKKELEAVKPESGKGIYLKESNVKEWLKERRHKDNKQIETVKSENMELLKKEIVNIRKAFFELLMKIQNLEDMLDNKQ